MLSSAPVALTTTFDFTAEGGYRASVDVTWHEIQALRFDDLADRFPTCVDLLRQGTDRDASDATVALYGSVVELTASFPAVNGFPWPTTQTLRATADGPDAAYLCGGGPEASYGTFSLSRTMRVGENTASFLFVQMSKKTPENPSGDLADRQIFSKDKVGVDGGGFIETCTATPKPAYVRDGSYGVPSSCGIVESPFLVD